MPFTVSHAAVALALGFEREFVCPKRVVSISAVHVPVQPEAANHTVEPMQTARAAGLAKVALLVSGLHWLAFLFEC